MSEYTPGISEIYRICEVMNSLEENQVGFFRWDDSLTFTSEDSDNSTLTEYIVEWSRKQQRYVVSINVKTLVDGTPREM